MKKDLYDYYGIQVPSPVDMDTIKPNEVENASSDKAILKAIYAFDPVTKLPTGDIMCYLSSTVAPEIKQYIMDNLMVDVSSQAMPKIPEGLDDDTVFALQRNPSEGVDSYRQRVSAFMAHQVEVRNMAIENAKRVSSSESAE